MVRPPEGLGQHHGHPPPRRLGLGGMVSQKGPGGQAPREVGVLGGRGEGRCQESKAIAQRKVIGGPAPPPIRWSPAPLEEHVQ